MTTPIPEAAVEAVMDLACRIEVETEDWELGHKHFEWCDAHYPDCEPREGRESEKYTWSRGEKPLCPVAREIVEAALTAARPLMEAETLSAWADYFDHYDDGPGRDPLTASKAAQLLRRPRPFGIAAATIAERTQR